MSWEGEVVSIQITPQGSEPLKHVEKVEAVAGKGLKGDRYFLRTGTYSKSPAWGCDLEATFSHSVVWFIDPA